MKQRKTRILFSILLTLLLITLGVSSTVAATDISADFEGGPPAGWFQYEGGGAFIAPSFPLIADTDALARPGQSGDNTVLQALFDGTVGFAGMGIDFAAGGATGPQDWSNYAGVSFWMYGDNSGESFQFEIMDNRSDEAIDTAERFDYVVTDNFSGWQKIAIPFGDFTRATDFQPGGAPDDGLTLTSMWGIAIVIDGNAGTITLDDIGLDRPIVDDFENGLPSGTDTDGNGIGFITFNDPDSGVGITTTDSPPAPVPGSLAGNDVLLVDTNVNNNFGFAGMVHAFENAALDTWETQDWSKFEGISFWLYGNNTGSTLFIDVLDNRVPGTTNDTAERYSLDIIDDFSGWQFFEIPFDSMGRKEVGNGAPNDGLGLTEVHGWAFGVFNSGQQFINYIDDVSLYGIAEIPELSVSFTANNFDINEGETGSISVTLNRPMGEDDPASASVDYASEAGLATPGDDYVVPSAGTLTFTKGGPQTLTFDITTLQDDKYEDTERVILRLSNPVDVAAGFVMQATAAIINDDPFDPLLLDDFERGAFLWYSSDDLTLTTPEMGGENILKATTLDGVGLLSSKQTVFDSIQTLIPASSPIITNRLQAALNKLAVGLNPNYWVNEYYLDAADGHKVFVAEQQAVRFLNQVANSSAPEAADAQLAIYDLAAIDATLAELAIMRAINSNGNSTLIANAQLAMSQADSAAAAGNYRQAISKYLIAWEKAVQAVQAVVIAQPKFGRDFGIDQDWSLSEGMTFMYYGQGTGEEITVQIKENRAADPGPSGWNMTWADEFNDPAGTPPNPENWSYEIGDGAVNGIPGWGNDELQYYTDSTDNAAMDGNGNLVITAREADGSLQCYYGECAYTSARLLSWYKAEFAYGRIEARVLVPDGEDGLWPAFWSLGTDIDRVGWPQTGEIDIMEYVSRLPEEIFGTIHGPGYSGGQSFGNTYPFPGGVSTDYHTFTIEWQPDLIEWYVDGILYHTATPADVAPNEWVFNDEVFLLLNLAIGGNFGGAVSDDLTFPQSMAIDYVRVYQADDTAERFETSFVDDFVGWQEVTVSFADLVRSDDQPAGAPNDGLSMSEVWGYGFKLPVDGQTTSAMVDQVRLTAPTEITVVNNNDSGSGSLRNALDQVAPGGDIYFDSSLANSTITFTSGPLVINKPVNIDGSGAENLTLDGNGSDRILIVDATGDATVSHMTMSNGFGWQLAGAILNNGMLTLDHVTVSNNVMATDAGDFWQGGGAIYTGTGGSTTIVDSTIDNNTSGWAGGGLYGFFGSTTTVIRSTVSNNTATDVGGGFRSLGDADITNSTLSGNESIGWHGGALFVTDGVVNVTNSTIAKNISPAAGNADVFVGTFGDSPATLNMTNNIVASDAGMINCFVAFFGAGTVTLATDHNNVFTDGTCFVGASDLIWGVDALGLGDLADNGGPTMTHALLAGSPAIDFADGAACPVYDQRGEARPQGAGCDAGSYESAP
ncbi:MAG: carbohydrate binding domain-containing protein [Chloroflexota bacterium]